MAIIWDKPTETVAPRAASGRTGIVWDDEAPPKPGLREALQPIVRGVFGPANWLRERASAYFGARPENQLLPTATELLIPPFLPGAAQAMRREGAAAERQHRAGALGSLAASPLDPTTYAFLPASMIANTPLRMGVSAAAGALPAWMQGASGPEIAAQAGLAGGLAYPSLHPAPKTALPKLNENLPGVPPESFYMSARTMFPEEFTPQVAESAAREGAELAIRPRPALPQAPRILWDDEMPSVGQFPRAFDAPPAPPASTVRQRGPLLGGKKGFVELPEEPAAKRAGRQIAAHAPTFYSHLERSLDEKMPNSASPEQVRGILRSSGVNQEELEWLDLESLLKDKPKVTKQEVLDYVRSNNVQVQEVVKGDLPGHESVPVRSVEEGDTVIWRGEEVEIDAVDPAPSQGQYFVALGGRRVLMDGDRMLRVAHRPTGIGAETKFHSYQLPGGTNYRELLLTMPPNEATWRVENLMTKSGMQPGRSFNSESEAAAFARSRGQQPIRIEHGERQGFRSSHFDEPNVLAHVRFNDRVDAQGKKVLFIEEIQSDWHQKGRKIGYQGEAGAFDPSKVTFRKSGDVWQAIYEGEVIGSGASEQGALGAAVGVGLKREAVPNAPFKKSWHELALKRMIRWAAEHGYDKLAWTTGEQQAARYDLSKHVKSVEYWPKSQQLLAYDLDGKGVIDKTVSPDKLADYIGKDAAEKLLAKPLTPVGPGSPGYQHLSGLDLKVGGEGMKGFYDSILPSYLNKYAKKWGGRVSESELRLKGAETEAEKIAAMQAMRRTGQPLPPTKPETLRVHSLDLTPSMRSDVLTKGQRKFGGFVALPEEEGVQRAGSQALASSLVKRYGTTQDPSEAMFISRDGQMVKKPAHLINEAYGFHEEVLQEAYPKQPKDSKGNEIARQEAFVRETGVVHFNSDGNAVNFTLPRRLTLEQAETVWRLAKQTPNAYITGIDYYYDTTNPVDLRKFNSAVSSRLGLGEQRGFVALPDDESASTASKQVATRAALPTTERQLPTETQTRVQQVIEQVKAARPIRENQEALYSKERGRRLAKVLGIRSRVGGEAGFHRELGALKGELPKVQYESLRGKVSQQDFDALLNDINTSKRITEWEKISAKTGLSKLFGLTGGEVPQRGELDLLTEVFGPELTRALLNKRAPAQKAGGFLLNTAGAMKTLRSSFDVSAALRQGVFLVGRQKQWLPAFRDMFKYFASEDAFTQAMEEIKSRPSYLKMREAKLSLTDLGDNLSSREEAFVSNFVEKVPGVKMSARAYTGFLNKLRADVFDDLMAKYTKLGIAERPGWKEGLAGYINRATGRGELPGPLGQASNLLNVTLFSPRLTASRLELLNPLTYVKLPVGVRREALRDLATFVGAGTTVLALAKLGGAEVGTDPRSADFGKIKIGDTRFDIWGGFQQPVRAMAQLISGKKINSVTGRETVLGEGYKPTTRLDIATSFLESKASPIASLVISLLKGQTGAGQPINVPAEIIDLFIPMIAQDMADLADERGWPSAWMAAPSLFGVGVQSYGAQTPMATKTPSGKETIKFRPPPSLGERAVNRIQGKQVTNVPKELHPQLQQARLKQQKLQAEVDKAKKLTLTDGQRRRVANVIIYLEKGVVKTKTLRRDKTPLQLYQANRSSR